MQVSIAGKQLVCPHCGGTDFDEGMAQLNTAFMTFFNLDWLNTSAKIYSCCECGRVEWFVPGVAPPTVDEDTDSVCLACNGRMPAGTDTCPACGWSYKE